MNENDIGASEGTPIFLLKTKSTPNDGYEEQFSAVKDEWYFEPVFVPVLEHRFLEKGLHVVRELLLKKQIGKFAGTEYGGLIFTSQRAVEAFAKLVEDGKGHGQWPHLQDVPIYTVGPATSRALRSIPQNPPLKIFGAETGNGDALAHYMLDHYIEWYQDRKAKPPVLFMVGEQRRDIIPKTLMDPGLSAERRIQVDELVVYGTGVMESFEQDFTKLLQDTEHRNVRWVVVFSPTGCDVMLRALGLLDPSTGKATPRVQVESKCKTYVATVGPTTRDYLRNNFGFEPDVCAGKPSPEGIEDGIRRFMTNKK